MLNIKKIKPCSNHIITTKDCYNENEGIDQSGIIARRSGTLKEYQTVVAVGPMVRDIKVGDIVCINPSRYGVRKHEKGSLKDGVICDNPYISYNFNVVEINHVQHLLLYDQDIDYIVEESEEENHTIVVAKSSLLE